MRILKPGFVIKPFDAREMLRDIEVAGRTCYKSEDHITEDSSSKFVKMLIQRGHEAMIEHASIMVIFTCDRGVSHEIVRHRVASYAQESTRYCNYGKDKFDNQISVVDIKDVINDLIGTNCKPAGCIDPVAITAERALEWLNIWDRAMVFAEECYLSLVNTGCPAQIARSVLPNSTKTEIVVTMNLREWRHFFRLRTAKAAHPQMREVTIPLLEQLKRLLPEVFEDISLEV